MKKIEQKSDLDLDTLYFQKSKELYLIKFSINSNIV